MDRQMVKNTLINTNEPPLSASDRAEFSDKLNALTESKEYTRSLIESNIDVLITTDLLGVINDVNRQFCELTEVHHDKLIGSRFKQYFTDQKQAENLIRKVLSENRTPFQPRSATVVIN